VLVFNAGMLFVFTFGSLGLLHLSLHRQLRTRS
jgi:hypothetical protein